MPLVRFSLNEPNSLLMIARKIKSLKAIILCEGPNDVDTIDEVVKKLGISIDDNIALSECGGICNLKELSSIVATLSGLSRKLEIIGLVEDADDKSVKERVTSLANSLRSHSIAVSDPEPVYGSIYWAKTDSLKFYFKIVGNFEIPLKRHEMEDYLVSLLLLRGDIEIKALQKFEKPSAFLEQYDKNASEIVNDSSDEEVKISFDNIIKLLDVLQN